LNPFQLESLIHSLKGKEIIGFDMVEVSSTKFGDITSINGAKAIYDFLCIQ
jgi:agmatinase